MHGQTYGFQSLLAGNEVDFIDPHTLLPLGTFRVKTARMDGEREIIVGLTKPVPQGIRDRKELAVENATYTPEVTIRGNCFARIPTRGILVTTRRPVLIEDNLFFRTQMSAILIADDARSWYESGMVRNVCIRGNRFERSVNCGMRLFNAWYGSMTMENNEWYIPCHLLLRYHGRPTSDLIYKNPDHLDRTHNDSEAEIEAQTVEKPLKIRYSRRGLRKFNEMFKN